MAPTLRRTMTKVHLSRSLSPRTSSASKHSAKLVRPLLASCLLEMPRPAWHCFAHLIVHSPQEPRHPERCPRALRQPYLCLLVIPAKTSPRSRDGQSSTGPAPTTDSPSTTRRVPHPKTQSETATMSRLTAQCISAISFPSHATPNSCPSTMVNPQYEHHAEVQGQVEPERCLTDSFKSFRQQLRVVSH